MDTAVKTRGGSQESTFPEARAEVRPMQNPVAGLVRTMLLATLDDMRRLAVTLPDGKYAAEQWNCRVRITVHSGSVDIRFDDFNF